MDITKPDIKTKICKMCGCEFDIATTGKGSPNTVYCSKECLAEKERARGRKRSETKSANRLSWTPGNRARLLPVIEIIDELKEYHPLTLRQIYYQLVGKGLIDNNLGEYKKVSNLLSSARIDGLIPWSSMEDRGREFTWNSGQTSAQNFIKSESEGFLKYYSRDLSIGQPYHVEVWIEKDAVSSIFQRICSKYCVPLQVGKGFNSVTVQRDFVRRHKDHYSKQKAIILYFGDFDPCGKEIPKSIEKNLKSDYGLENFELREIALSLADIEKYDLPHKPDAIKTRDVNKDKFIKKFGDVAVELDALPVNVLNEKIENAIKSVYDLKEYERQVEQEQKDRILIEQKRIKMMDLLADGGGDLR